MEELRPDDIEDLLQELEEEHGVEEPLDPKVEALLQDLQPAKRYPLRRLAAKQLGEVSRSSRQVVQALVTAAETDSAPGVRAAAAHSLRAPVHQECLQQHPELEEAAKSALPREGPRIIPQPRDNGVGWGFWLTWVLASAAGLAIGAALDSILAISLSAYVVLGGGSTGVQGGLALLFGLGVGTSQWLVLRQKLDNAGWWILASIPFLIAGQLGGLALFQPEFVLWGIGSRMELLYFGQLVHFRGLGVGLAQWLVLRRQIPQAGWWILVCVFGWSMGVAVYNAIALEAGWFLGNVLAGAFVGAITGAGLVWLLREQVPIVRGKENGEDEKAPDSPH